MSLLRPTIDGLRAYVPTPPQPGHRLHLNESPADLPAEVKREALERVAALDWSRYPEEAELLAADLAARDGWKAEGLLLGNGSNELLQTLLWSALSAEDAVVLAAPSFSLYTTQARAVGAHIVEVPLRERQGAPFRFEVDRLVHAARESSARLVFVASPNNPTGTPLGVEEVVRLHDETAGLVAVDEAYRDFARQDFAPLLARCERLVLLRTFSKSFAAAALRLGYLLAAPSLCRELHKVQMPYNVGAVTAALGRALLARPELMQERVAHVVAERERVLAGLRALPRVRVENGLANFVVFEHEARRASEMAAELARRGVLARDLSGYAGCGRCVRASMGTREGNDALLAALAEVV